jgi:hypothetical protein
MNPNSRRDFLKLSTLSLIGAAAASRAFAPSSAYAQAGKPAKMPMVSESEPQAKALGYIADATKVDLKKWPKKAGVDGKSQVCGNCMLFNGGKVTTDKEGPCSLFPQKHVAAAGWCNSWVKNPAAK